MPNVIKYLEIIPFPVSISHVCFWFMLILLATFKVRYELNFPTVTLSLGFPSYLGSETHGLGFLSISLASGVCFGFVVGSNGRRICFNDLDLDLDFWLQGCFFRVLMFDL